MIKGKEFGMVRLVASDVDGTLLQKDEQEISQTVFDVIHRLCERNVLFAVASGRAYHELKRLFEPVSDQIIFISLDGALVVYRGRVLMSCPLDKRYIQEFADGVVSRFGCDVVCSGRNLSYFQSESQPFEEMLRQNYHQHVVQVDRLSEIREDIFKLSFYNGNSGLQNEKLPGLRSDKLAAIYTDNGWLEFVARGTDKGAAIAFLQKKFAVPKAQVMAFGDNFNDIGMLRAVGEGYAMAEGKQEVRTLCRYVTDSVVDTLNQYFF